ncbi:MAG TPA: isoamylase early set domain-containing protein [Tepidisphaeraceae bacterium]
MTTVTPGGTVEFRFYRPEAQKVSVAGTFNRWSPTALQMSSDGEGWWTVKATLPAGEYKFRYVADGQWFTDFAAYGIEPTSFGMNSVLVVSKAMAAKRPVPELKHELPLEEAAQIQRDPILQASSHSTPTTMTS